MKEQWGCRLPSGYSLLTLEILGGILYRNHQNKFVDLLLDPSS